MPAPALQRRCIGAWEGRISLNRSFKDRNQNHQFSVPREAPLSTVLSPVQNVWNCSSVDPRLCTSFRMHELNRLHQIASPFKDIVNSMPCGLTICLVASLLLFCVPLQLSPWLHMDSPAVLHWQRGDKRRGESKAVMPIPMVHPSAAEGGLEGPEAYKIVFEEVFVVSGASGERDSEFSTAKQSDVVQHHMISNGGCYCVHVHCGAEHAHMLTCARRLMLTCSGIQQICFPLYLRMPQIPATLYFDLYRGGTKYRSKALVFTVHEAGAPPGAEPLGKGKIDLADFADRDEVQQVSIPLSVSRGTSAFLGTPNLTVYIFCASKKMGRTAGAKDNHG